MGADDSTPKEPREIEESRWTRNNDGKIDLKPLKHFGTALLGDPGKNNYCGLRLEFLDGEDVDSLKPDSLQLSMSPVGARALSAALESIAHMAAHTDPRKEENKTQLQAATSRRHYPPIKRCIYCNATKYSDDRLELGEEHIVPLCINGDWIIPEAACKTCEVAINKEFEQFCNQITFGPLRYYLGLESRRPKERSSELSVSATIDGKKIEVDAPVDSVPAMLVLPLLELPGICLGQDHSEKPITTKDYWFKIFQPTKTGWIQQNKIESIRTSSGATNLEKFGMLIAKIAHGFAIAECRHDPDFSPTLADRIKSGLQAPPPSYLIGGESSPLPATSNLHELEVIRCGTAKHSLIVVRIRLFARFGAPTYYAVVSASPRNKRRGPVL